MGMLYHRQNKSAMSKEGELLEKPDCSDAEDWFKVTFLRPLKAKLFK